MVKVTFRKPDNWDDQKGFRERVEEDHSKEVEQEIRQPIEEGSVSEEAYRRIKLIMYEYDERPESLLQALSSIANLCADMFPETKPIAEKFQSALHRYGVGKVKTLDEAIGVSRPSHWRQSSEAFYFENGYKVATEVGVLLDDGASTPGVFDQVGERYCKSGKTIEKIYYRVIKELEERFNAFEKAEEDLLTDKPELVHGRKIRFTSIFLKKFMNK